MAETWTVGHSTRSLDDFVTLLREHRIKALADVRRFPRSRHNPQFNQEALAVDLPARGVEYHHVPNLGGFRGDYLEHMKTAEFEEGLKELLWIAVAKPTAVMCAEAVFFRCHRRFIAEALVKRGIKVWHIFAPSVVKEHIPREERPLEEFA